MPTQKILLSEKQLAAIGKITVNMTTLEYTLILFISRLLGSERLGFAITAGSTGNGLLQTLNSIYRVQIRGEAYLDDLVALLSSIEKLQERRNQIVHAFWHNDYETGLLRRIKIKRHKKQGYIIDDETIAADDLNELGEIIALADRVLNALLGKLIKSSLIKVAISAT